MTFAKTLSRAGPIEINQMLNKLITRIKQLLDNKQLIMYMMKEIKNYVIRVFNWFTGLIRRSFRTNDDLLEIQVKYTRDKVSKVVLFL